MNYWLFLAIIGSLTLTTVATAVKGRRHWIVPGLVTVLFIRLVPYLPPTWHWRHDSYYYYIVTEGMMQTASLSLPTWVTTANGQAATKAGLFSYHVFTVVFAEITGVTDGAALRAYFPVLLGPIVLLAAVTLLRRVLPLRFAVLSGFLYTMLDISVLFNTEYHPQAFTVPLFILLLYLVLFDEGLRRRRTVLGVVVGVSFVFSHNFTPLFALTTLVAYTFSRIGWAVVVGDSRLNSGVPLATVVVTACMVFAGNELVYGGLWPVITERLYGIVTGQSVPQTITGQVGSPPTFKNSGGASVIDSLSLVVKFALSAVATVTGVRLLRGELPEDVERMLFVGVGMGVAGVAGSIIDVSALSRSFLFSFLPLIAVAAWAVARWDAPTPTRRTLVTLGVTALVLANVLTGPAPSLIDEEVDINADGYHEVEPIRNGPPQEAGSWFRAYHRPGEPDNVFAVWRFRPVVNYYGRVGDLNSYWMHDADRLHRPRGDRGYGLWDEGRQFRPPPGTARIYDGGRLFVSFGCTNEPVVEKESLPVGTRCVN